MLAPTTTSVTTATDVSLLVISNLNMVASLPNSTASRRRQVATILSKSVFDLSSADTSTATDGSGSNNVGLSSSDGNKILIAKTTQVVASVLKGATDSDTSLNTATSKALVEASSSVLRTTAEDSGSIPSSGSSFDRQSIASTVGAVARATNRSDSSTSIAARSISFTRASITLAASAIKLSAYKVAKGRAGQDAASRNQQDPQGLAHPSAVVISSNLLGGGAPNRGGSRTDAFVFQFSEATNPFSSKVASDVVVVRVDSGGGVTNVNNKSTAADGNAPLFPASPVGNVSVEMFPRNSNSTDEDECKAVYNVKSSGLDGLKAALPGACGKWNESTQLFEPVEDCTLTNATMNGTGGTWSLRCDCAVARSELKAGTTLALVGYSFGRFGTVFQPGLVVQISGVPTAITIIPIVIALVGLIGIHILSVRAGTARAWYLAVDIRAGGLCVCCPCRRVAARREQPHQPPPREQETGRGNPRNDEGDFEPNSCNELQGGGGGGNSGGGEPGSTVHAEINWPPNSEQKTVTGEEKVAVEVCNPLNSIPEAILRRELRNFASLRRTFGHDNDHDHRIIQTDVVRGLFRIEMDGGGGDGEIARANGAAEEMSGVCNLILRRPWQKRMWITFLGGLRNSHELLAIFLAARKPGWGASERLVIFLGGFASQVMSVTLMFYLHQCFQLSSIFDADTMAVTQLVEARIGMLIAATLFTVPLDLLVSVAFAVNRKELEARQREHDGNSADAVEDPADDVGGSCSRITPCLRRCRKCLKRCFESKICRRARPFTFMLPWAVVALQVSICSAVTIVLTAAGSNGSDTALPCRCRISHSSHTSGRWFTVVVLQLFCWLCVSRPAMIALGLFASVPSASWFVDKKARLSTRLQRLSTWGKGMVVQAKPEEVDVEMTRKADLEMVEFTTGGEVGVVATTGGATGNVGEGNHPVGSVTVSPRTASVDLDDIESEGREVLQSSSSTSNTSNGTGRGVETKTLGSHIGARTTSNGGRDSSPPSPGTARESRLGRLERLKRLSIEM
jgi:hypothetical protein